MRKGGGCRGFRFAWHEGLPRGNVGKTAWPQHGGHSNIASQVHDIFDVFRVDRIQVIFVVKKYLFEDKQVGCARPVMKWHRSAVESKVDGSSSGAQGAIGQRGPAM